MAQQLAGDFPIDPTTTNGTKLAQILNRFQQAQDSGNSGAAPPPSTYPGMTWLDTSGGGEGVLKMRNAANTGWIVLSTPGGVTGLVDGTVAAPGLAWASELGMGWYRITGGSRGFAEGGALVERLDASVPGTTEFRVMPRAASGIAQLVLENRVFGGTGPVNNMQLLINADGTAVFGSNAGGGAAAKGLSFNGWAVVGFNQQLTVGGSVSINQGAGVFGFANNGGTINLDIGNAYPSISFNTNQPAYQLIHNRATGDLIYQKPGSPAKNLMYVRGNELGADFVGSVTASAQVVAQTNLVANTGAVYAPGAFRTTGNVGVNFDDNADNPKYIALGDPAYGQQMQIAFLHEPGVWAGARIVVSGSGTFQFTDGGIPRASRSGPWDSLVSDGRVKENVEDFTDGLAAVLKLRPRRFNYIAETGIEGPQLGYVVQEAEGVLPTAPATITVEGFDDLKTLSIQPVEYMLVNAVKTLHARLTQLEGATAP